METINNLNKSPKPLFGMKAPTKAVMALSMKSVMNRAVKAFHAIYTTTPLNKSGCKIWSSTLTADGYGIFSFHISKEEKMELERVYGVNFSFTLGMTAHRFAYLLKVDQMAAGGSISHLCHNRACFNQDHIEMSDHRSNIMEKIANRRHSRLGSKGNRYDTEFLAQALLPIYLGQESRYSVSKRTGISRPWLSIILNGKGGFAAMKRTEELAKELLNK